MSQTMLTGDQIKTLLGGDLPADYVLNSVYEIENVLLMLKAIKKKADWFKELKKHRAATIDEKINELEEKSDRLRAVVLATMKKLEPDHTTLNFPSIGAVTRKKSAGKWNVENEELLTDFLDKNGFKDDVFKVTSKLDNTKLRKVLEDMSDARVAVPGVSHIEGDETVSIKYEVKNSKPSVVAENQVELVKQTDDLLDTLDGISIDDI